VANYSAKNPSLYSVALKKWKDATDEKLLQIARQACQELAFQVVEKTPVDTGFLKGSWQPSLNGPVGKSDATPDKSGSSINSEIGLVVTGLKLGDTFYMVNNAAYARRIEYGFVGEDSLGRRYNQAGRYFVRDAMAKARSIISRLTRELGK
jgi:hypothetical protein